MIKTDNTTMILVKKVKETRAIFLPFDETKDMCDKVVVVSEDKSLNGMVFFVLKSDIVKKGKLFYCLKSALVGQLHNTKVEEVSRVMKGYGKQYKGSYPKVEFASNAARNKYKKEGLF